MGVEFNDFTIRCLNAMDDKINAGLEECAGVLESQVKRNTRVETGETKRSFKHEVDESNHIAYIGSTSKNAIWEEFGTGEHALNGDGRRGGWRYEDEQGNWHYTKGKKPSRAFWNAYNTKKNVIINRLKQKLKEM